MLVKGDTSTIILDIGIKWLELQGLCEGTYGNFYLMGVLEMLD